MWGLDLLGPFTTAPGGYKHILVACDYFTKWIEAKPLVKMQDSDITTFVHRSIICRYGVPNILITDNGTQFTSRRFAELCS